LLSFFCLSLAQSLIAFAAVSDPSSAGYTQTSLQAAYSSSWPLYNRSSEVLSSTATQTVSLPPIGSSTVISDASSVAEPSATTVPSSLGGYTTSSVTPSATAIIASHSSAVQNGSASGPSASTTQIGASFSPLPAFTSSTSTSQSVVLSSTVAASASSTSTTASNNATSTTSPLPASVNSFSLVGCVASADGYQGFQLRENTTAMSIGRCVSNCVEFAYAGTFDT
jgi:hypothetical protein